MSFLYLTTAFLILATAIALVCSLGLLFVDNALQRVHYSGVIATLSGPCIAIAVFIDDVEIQSRIKILLIVLMTLVSNTILAHATARAIFIRQKGRWLRPGEQADKTKLSS